MSVGNPVVHVHFAGATQAASVSLVLSEHEPARSQLPKLDAAMPPRMAGSHAEVAELYDDTNTRYELKVVVDVGFVQVNVAVVSVMAVTAGAVRPVDGASVFASTYGCDVRDDSPIAFVAMTANEYSLLASRSVTVVVSVEADKDVLPVTLVNVVTSVFWENAVLAIALHSVEVVRGTLAVTTPPVQLGPAIKTRYDTIGDPDPLVVHGSVAEVKSLASRYVAPRHLAVPVVAGAVQVSVIDVAPDTAVGDDTWAGTVWVCTP